MAVYGSIWQPMAVYGSNGRVNKYVKVHGKTMTIKMSTKTRHRMASRCIRYVRHLIYSVSKCVGKVCVCVCQLMQHHHLFKATFHGGYTKM